MPVLARVRFERLTGLSADAVHNNFAFTDLVPGPTQSAAVIAFYQQTTGQTASIGSRIAATVSRGVLASTVELYNLDTPEKLTGGDLGSPALVVPWQLDVAAAGPDLPAEVAVELSYRADYGGSVEEGPGGTRPRARRRGRVYIGPLKEVASSQSGGGAEVRPDNNFLLDLLAAGSRLRDDPATTWGVWSRADGVVRPVTQLFVDDAFDTQRRRGPAVGLTIGG